MNTQIMEAAGFHKELALIGEGLCPTCAKPVGKFRDPLSKKEFTISGMCQACQGSVFNPECENEEVDCYSENLFSLKRINEAFDKGHYVLAPVFGPTFFVLTLDLDGSATASNVDTVLRQSKLYERKGLWVGEPLITKSPGGNTHLYSFISTPRPSNTFALQAILATLAGSDTTREYLSAAKAAAFEAGNAPPGAIPYLLFETPEEGERVLEALASIDLPPDGVTVPGVTRCTPEDFKDYPQ